MIENLYNNESYRQASRWLSNEWEKDSQLSFPIMSSHIDFPAVNHPKVSSDQNCLARLFLTDYCKALSRADFNKDDFHLMMNFSGLRARRRPQQYSIRYIKKTEYLSQMRINTLLL